MPFMYIEKVLFKNFVQSIFCEQLPLRTLRSHLANFEEGVDACVPQGTGPTAVEAQQQSRSLGSQMDLTEGLEMGLALSLPSPQRAHVAVSILCGGHRCLPHSFGWNVCEERPIGISLRPAERTRVPTWDLAIALQGLSQAPFESLEEVPASFLTLKTLFLLAISFVKRIRDLQVLLVAPSCFFAPGMVKAFLHPRPGYISKVPTNVACSIVL